MSAAVTDTKAWGRRAARLRATLSKQALRLRTALGKLALRLRTALGELWLRLRIALAVLTLWLAVQRFRLMPMSIDTGTKLRNPPPAEVRQLEQQPGPPVPPRAGEPRHTTQHTSAPSPRRGPHQRLRAGESLYLGRRNAASAAAGRPPRLPRTRPPARPTARQGRATAPRNRHPERRPRTGHPTLDGLQTVLALIRIIPLIALRLFGLLRLFGPIRFRGRK